MKVRISVILVGMPGSGKTSMARALAQGLDWKFLDLDHELLQNFPHLSSISELFLSLGEAGFRKLEATWIKDHHDPHPYILATGGGAILNAHSWELLKSRGLTIWLDPPIEDIVVNLSQDQEAIEHRPFLKGSLLTKDDLTKRLNSLYAQRQHLYAKAHLRVKPSRDMGQTVQDLTLQIEAYLAN